MSLTVRWREQRGVPVVAVAGPAEPETLGGLADDLDRLWQRSTGPVVVDLSEATLIADPALRGFLQRVTGLDRSRELRLVCNRMSGRKALRLCSPEVYRSVFGSVELAVDSCLASEPA